MDELNKQNIGEETAAAHPVGENTQPVPPAGTGAQQAQQPEGEGTTASETQLGKLVCPRCGNAFEPKEKKCPHCGMKNNLKLCKTCGATIAKNAKRCPKCGAKNKKPIYKWVWFWVIVVLFGWWLVGNVKSAIGEALTGTTLSPEEAIAGVWIADAAYDDKMQEIELSDEEKNIKLVFNEDHTVKVIMAGISMGDRNWEYHKTDIDGNMVYSITEGEGTLEITGSRGKYKAYSGKLVMDGDGQIVVFAKSTDETAGDYSNTGSMDELLDSIDRLSEAVDNMDTDGTSITQGKKNALKMAGDYLNLKGFSYSKLIEQLEYEGFTPAEAKYAANNCGADWNEQAVRKATEYLKLKSFSRAKLIEQLEYEGFTHEQAVYGADQAY